MTAPLMLEPVGYAAWLDGPVSTTALFATPEKLTLDVKLITV